MSEENKIMLENQLEDIKVKLLNTETKLEENTAKSEQTKASLEKATAKAEEDKTKLEVQQATLDLARKTKEAEDTVGLLATLEQDKADLKRTSDRLVRKIELLKGDADKLQEEAERASASPWEDEEWEELSRVEVFDLIRADLVPAQQARLAVLCLEELKAAEERSRRDYSAALDKISKLTDEKTKLEARICFLTQPKDGGDAAPSEEAEEAPAVAKGSGSKAKAAATVPAELRRSSRTAAKSADLSL